MFVKVFFLRFVKSDSVIKYTRLQNIDNKFNLSQMIRTATVFWKRKTTFFRILMNSSICSSSLRGLILILIAGTNRSQTQVKVFTADH